MRLHRHTALAASLLIATQTQAQQGDTLAPITVNRDMADSYTVPATATATGLNLSVKDTPQSVSVITRQQMDDRGLTTLEDALKTTTGLNIYRQGYHYRTRRAASTSRKSAKTALTVPSAPCAATTLTIRSS